MTFAPDIILYTIYCFSDFFNFVYVFFYKKVAIHTLAAIPANVASSAPANV